MLEMARRSPEDERRPPYQGLAITGYAAITPHGNTEQTWDALVAGRSAVRQLDVNNFRTNIGAPVDFRSEDHFSKRELRGKSRLVAMSIVMAREALGQAGMLDANGKVSEEFTRDGRMASWISSGIGTTYHLIDVHNTIHNTVTSQEQHGEIFSTVTRDARYGSSRISPMDGLETFPEQINAQTAMDVGITGGWGGNTAEACATGASNIAEAARLIKDRWADAVVAGGFDDVLNEHREVGVGIFSGMRTVLSPGNGDPARASRPFDRDRDGFALGAGGGLVVVEELGHAQRRGAPIYAYIDGFGKSMDGKDATGLDKQNVARMIVKTFMKDGGGYYPNVDAIFAHATSTKEGDKAEKDLLEMVFGEALKDIPVTAIKSSFGHLLGGAGSVNIIAAIEALRNGIIPPVANFENPDEGMENLLVVRDEPLVRPINRVLTVAYGFGGYDASMILSKAPQS